ncbi:MAG: DsbC family protein [Gammaproteobacteria bacterium]
MKPTLRLLIPVAAATLVAAAALGEPATRRDVRAEIARRLEVDIESVKPSPIAGLYEIRSGAEVGYVSVDGRFYVDGDVFDMQSRENLTEVRRQEGRLGLLHKVADGEAIVFAPAGQMRHTLTVFTDIDCAYCRRMHQEMAELNRLGIRVRYLLYPRGGPGSESWKKAEAVWCSADRKDALTRAKRGETMKAGRCESPVAAHYALGREMGIRGTPGLITDRGEYLAGYLPAAQLAQYLEAPAADAASD